MAVSRRAFIPFRSSLRSQALQQNISSRRWLHSQDSVKTEEPFPTYRDVHSLRQTRRQMFKDGKEVGFVPTMGALHDGHLNLVRHALQENTDVFVSIYVNPTQFGVNEDLDKYPKTWDADMQKLQQLAERLRESSDNIGQIAGIFAPTTKVMYPVLPPSSKIDGDGSFVTITPMGKWFEGASRPVFFRGVATVCTKLFNIVQPDRVYFGQKDAQQSVLIRRMVKDFHIPTEVKVISTSREDDGLAMSSRNVYLGERRRKDAAVLSRALFKAQKRFDDGVFSAKQIRQAAFDVFDATFIKKDGAYVGNQKIEIDYIALTKFNDFSVINDDQQVDPSEGAILSAAIKVYPVHNPKDDAERAQISVRLIDNVILAAKSQ